MNSNAARRAGAFAMGETRIARDAARTQGARKGEASVVDNAQFPVEHRRCAQQQKTANGGAGAGRQKLMWLFGPSLQVGDEGVVEPVGPPKIKRGRLKEGVQRRIHGGLVRVR